MVSVPRNEVLLPLIVSVPAPILVKLSEVLLTIAYTGAITLFVAATVAVVVTDIKKVLAYSTVSQLGYMVYAIGAGGAATAGAARARRPAQRGPARRPPALRQPARDAL